jgi:hypothetical protein
MGDSLMTTNSLFRSVALAGTALLVITFAQRTARADEVFIAGSTLGCFGVGCTPQASFTGLGFTFSSSTFATTTTSGSSNLGGVANPGSNNLGTITMSTTPGNLAGQTFTLQITFTAPQGFTGSNPLTITYSITPFNMIGGVFLEPNPFSLILSFNDLNCEPNPTGGIPGQQTTCGTGSFGLGLFDIGINPGETMEIAGFVGGAQQQPIPEPATVLLLGTGLAGVAIKTRKKFKTRKRGQGSQ